MMKIKQRITWFLIILISIPTLAFCQDDLQEKTKKLEDSIRFMLYKERPYFEVVNYGANRIQMEDSTSLDYFFEALYKLQNQKEKQEKSTQVKILHIGDSHVQADFFTGKVRQLFQEDKRFGDAGRGFVFPYSAAKTNNPFDYKTRYTGTWTSQKMVSSKHQSQWGISGITVETTSPTSTITIEPIEYNERKPTKIDKVKIYYPILNEELFEAVIIAPTNEIKSQKMHPDGYLEVIFNVPQTSVSIGLDKTDDIQTHFILQGISFESNEDGVLYHAVGINGAETRHYLRCEDFETQLRSIKPDLVVISLGTNDAYPAKFDDVAYKGNLSKIISQIRNINSEVSILLTSPNDTYRYKKYANYNTQKAEKRLQELMREKKIAFWNFYQIMGGFKSITEWQKAGLGQYDRIHLSQTGYNLQGDLFYEAIEEQYQNWLENQRPK
ncbi:GDSL-type esterase/lipase family protein [Bernardetia sp.]|uniref:GDSL-type esterase/lipase family protein n=1 Tax=Bernardetia sp. TaxID=1937974 RepID=UPI0025C0B1B4|nr:GDSL-type esterase/lipase family protein [Bernardetia sp.]